jgi:hypothetical protein|tara:strand:+ start:532 stop:951 length:420 start_codon:yes stop_codon:yes gene_type:complete
MDLKYGDKIEVYRNLHKNCFSVRHKGKVVGYLHDNEQLALTNVTFAVQPAGRAKVLRENKKNVHAFVRGEYVGFENNLTNNLYFGKFEDLDFYAVSYNPYKSDKFVVKETGKPIESNSEALIRGGKVLLYQDKRLDFSY